MGASFCIRDAARATGWDLWTLPLNEAGASVPVVQTESDDRNGQFSRDGKWIAYESNSSGPSEVFMQPFAAPGKPVQVSTKGGAQPRWRADGKELFYIALDGTLMAVPVRTVGAGRVRAGWHTRSAFSRPPWHGPESVAFGAQLHRLRRWAAVSDGHVRARCEPTPIRLILNWSPAASHDRSLAGAGVSPAEPTVIRR